MFRKPTRLACAVSELAVSARSLFVKTKHRLLPPLTMHKHCTVHVYWLPSQQCDLEKRGAHSCGQKRVVARFLYSRHVSWWASPFPSKPHTELTPLQMIAATKISQKDIVPVPVNQSSFRVVEKSKEDFFCSNSYLIHSSDRYLSGMVLFACCIYIVSDA